MDDELTRLRIICHEMEWHPDWEYANTRGPRKGLDMIPPAGDGWELNTARGLDGFGRFDNHDEYYWRRLRTPVPEGAIPATCTYRET